ncbi:bifunctional DNA primase/polymerase [Mycobacterium sp. SMC-17]|uniref:bifunctional DNA primase/polymerase n=1 Tax=Mycobacterium sp. SMC-17 TaxID=3381628 RepID=UPI003876FCB8
MTGSTLPPDAPSGPRTTKRVSRLKPKPSKSLDAAKGDRNPYGCAAGDYLAAGWFAFPLLPNEKHPPPAGITGRKNPYPTTPQAAERVEAWRTAQPEGNVGLWLGPVSVGGVRYDVLGIDVDDYADGGKIKTGAVQLEKLEAEHGPLPATWVSTSRGAANPSGIRFFRVPTGLAWAGKADKDIDIIQTGHRYAVVWPSRCDGRRYSWYAPDGQRCTEIPDPAGLPELPEAWVDYLTEGRRKASEAGGLDMDLSIKELYLWAETTLPDFAGEPCDTMQGRGIDHHIRQIEEDASSHDKITNAHWALVCLAAEGHCGLNTAIAAVEAVWINDTVKARGKRGVGESKREIFRSWTNAIRKLKGQIDSGRRTLIDECGCCVLTEQQARHFAETMERQRVSNSSALQDDPDLPPSWAAIDLRAAMRDAVNVVATVLHRSDGAALFYPGKVHSVHGESESGKSWLALCAAAECMGRGQPVLYVDFEDSAASVAKRLLLLGVEMDSLCNPEMFRYINPEINPAKGTTADKQAFVDTVNGTYSLAVIDGVTESMTLYGLSGKDSDDVATWHQQLPKVLARHTGAAVVCIDHVTKDPTTRSRWAQGSQHKMAALDGAAYVVEAESPLAVGQAGRVSVRVAKDRPGRVRGLAGKWRKSDRTQHVADLHLDSTDTAKCEWRLMVPEDAGSSTDVDEVAPGKGRPRRILCWHMEQISRHLESLMQKEEQASDAASVAKVRAQRTRNKIAEVMEGESERRGRGKQRDYWREALQVLVDENFLEITEGQRRSHIHNVVMPYRASEDPLSDKYSGVSKETVNRFRVPRLGIDDPDESDDEMGSES